MLTDMCIYALIHKGKVRALAAAMAPIE